MTSTETPSQRARRELTAHIAGNPDQYSTTAPPPPLAVVDDDYTPPDEPMDGWQPAERAAAEHADAVRALRFTNGAEFILDSPDVAPAVWGAGTEILWPEGESLIIVGGDGTGKTTLAGQLVRARLGLQDEVLGYPVQPGQRRILYLAMDRPRQASRSMARQFDADDRAVLAERMSVWRGPPLADMAADTGLLTAMCRAADADTVIVDSIKDAAVGLSDDKVGAGWNRARQAALAAGVQVLELHHPRKQNAAGGPPDSLADLYGSRWIAAGAGSVIGLHGEAGDPIVSFRHLKQPMDELGPWLICHDQRTGRSERRTDDVDPLLVLRGRPDGITSRELAMVWLGAEKPKPAQVEKARRKLAALADEGLALHLAGHGRTPDKYFPAARADLTPPAPEPGERENDSPHVLPHAPHEPGVAETKPQVRTSRDVIMETDPTGTSRTSRSQVKPQVTTSRFTSRTSRTGPPHAPPLKGGERVRPPHAVSEDRIIEALAEIAPQSLGVRDIASCADIPDIRATEAALKALLAEAIVERRGGQPGVPTTWALAGPPPNGRTP